MDFYSTIEQARKTGKVEKGINEVTKAVERGVAKLVVYAKDVEPKEIVAHIPALCKEKGVECHEVDSKVKLGAAVGISVGCTSACITHVSDVKVSSSKPSLKKAK